jgi:hypothetical protein
VADSGARLYACKATVDMFELTMDDFVPQVDEIISVGEFYEKAPGGQVIFTEECRQTRRHRSHPAENGRREGYALRSWPAARQDTTR